MAGLEAERRLPGGIAVRTRRDRIGRVAETSMLDGTDELRRVAYTWEPGSLLKERDDSRRGLTRYFHDQRARLTAAAEPSGRVRWRRPTATGDIQPAIEGEPRTYKKGGALVAADGVKFEYDRDGNRAAKVWPDGRREKYTWNAAGRLVGITKPDGKVVRFEYDALGRRVKKISDAEERVWVWDGDVPLHELSTKEGPIAWVFEPGTFTLAAKVQGLRRWAIVADQVGAPCAVFDEWGGVAWQGEVDVYGKAAAEVEKTALPWRFPGQYEDGETGLFYNRFRYHDPEMGAYVSKDPIGLLGGLRAYGYVADPLTWSDALGLSGCTRVYRGTNFGEELYIHEQTGLLMSDAARDAYRFASDAGATTDQAIAAALRASKAAHAQNVAHWGSLDNYVQAHGLWGIDLGKMTPRRSMISLTTDPDVAGRFGSRSFSGSVPTKLLIPQSIDGATEAEVLILHMIALR
ncbi:RHS repeat domain-containing protein [Polyangium fumosum]|uniref:RHS repeat domain-containing protein n=1 Tax=Polyangium fumosum TaxID=889272 RepID=UPI0014782C78|nr:RHS repeat-associated core domain-containing protein [Polyangium fumosum]